ncbi:rod shape-determining protein MreD [Aestuariivita sp.]|jgi:rod shape-determining protein MreD|uniref:rod shape-determining protein MreD n=1 Tax=Aestuariivita sp. TaxID=1872407 RepID=UPI00216D89A7|nr:rod shape-determining protein MreD [Aestuariivita sp.]MCE8007564.1 rod shape-determining protein MreD [Aestuariivita sp.]
MASQASSQVWAMRALYAMLALVILFWSLLPLSTLPASWAGPDLILALTFAWALRRPDFVPALLIALVILLGDLLLQRPPGLMAFLVVLGAEQLKTRAIGLRDASFAGEWAAASLVVISVAALNRVILAVLMVDQAPLGLTLSQAMLTILIYPVIVVISHLLFGVRKLSPGDDDAIGSRI